MDMEKRKKKNLESKGYKVGSVEEFLGMSAEESEYIELKLVNLTFCHFSSITKTACTMQTPGKTGPRIRSRTSV